MRLRFCNSCAPLIAARVRRDWIYFLVALLVIAAATLPFDVQDHPHWMKVAWVPFVSGVVRPIDLLMNAALYLPIGYVLPIASCRRRVATAAGIALLVSLGLEVSQVWSHQRFPSATDLIMNIFGSVAGAAIANGKVRRRRGVPATVPPVSP